MKFYRKFANILENVEFFLLIAHGHLCTLQLHREYSTDYTEICFFQKNPVVASLLTDRNWSVAVGVGKNFGWDASASVRPQPKIRRKNCEIPSPARTPSRGPSALVLYTKNTRKTPKSTFPDLPEWVWTAAAGHTFSLWLKKLKFI